MASLKKRLGATVFLAVLSLVSIILLLVGRSGVHAHLKKIGLSGSLSMDVLGWRKKGGNDNRARVIVFGDSWVDDSISEGEDGKGENWTKVLCDEISCTSYQNFAVTQPRDAYPAQPPNGAMVSNTIQLASLLNSPSNLEPNSTPITLLPDLDTQIKSFIALPPPEILAKETLFIISLGFWDIYNFASLDYALAKNAIDQSIDELFTQLDILYTHYNSSLPSITSTSTNTTAHTFQIIVSKVLDPSVSPGWLSQRPSPVKPSSIAEQQKNSAYLTQRWNQGVENKLGLWLRSPEELEEAKANAKEASIAAAIAKSKPKSKPAPASPPISTPTSTSNKTVEAEVLKDVFYYDLPLHLLNTIVEHHMESEGLTDAAGFGAGDSPYENVERPCVFQADDDEDTLGLGELGNGMTVCVEPDMWLWWDAWVVGARAQKVVGKEVAVLVGSGGSERARLASMESSSKDGGFWSGKTKTKTGAAM